MHLCHLNIQTGSWFIIHSRPVQSTSPDGRQSFCKEIKSSIEFRNYQTEGYENYTIRSIILGHGHTCMLPWDNYFPDNYPQHHLRSISPELSEGNEFIAVYSCPEEKLIGGSELRSVFTGVVVLRGGSSQRQGRVCVCVCVGGGGGGGGGKEHYFFSLYKWGECM